MHSRESFMNGGSIAIAIDIDIDIVDTAETVIFSVTKSVPVTNVDPATISQVVMGTAHQTIKEIEVHAPCDYYRYHSADNKGPVPGNQQGTSEKTAHFHNQNSRVDQNSTSTSAPPPVDNNSTPTPPPSTLESMDTSPDNIHESTSPTSSTVPTAAKTASPSYPASQDERLTIDTNKKMTDKHSKKSMADDLKITHHYNSTEGTIKDYQIIRQIGLKLELKIITMLVVMMAHLWAEPKSRLTSPTQTTHQLVTKSRNAWVTGTSIDRQNQTNRNYHSYQLWTNTQKANFN
ncbi:unnamed protein product [Ambrosiozyma monospora]|uniref:Unnamed protein product n=1 Tax=Ambrosiozyma monospora TaxID=43982 RepID=A0ACB5SU39_AMBMO|nr:unnamed protein product [Ambrosiozyma monospora]